MYYFCTYFNKNYLSRGLALHESLCEQSPSFRLFVLCLDDFAYDFLIKYAVAEIIPVRLSTLEDADPALKATKHDRSIVEYYFTLTPCWPHYLLEQRPEINMITYLDSDIYFYSSPQVLFEELGSGSVLMMPHRFSEKNRSWEQWGKYNVVYNTFRRDADGMMCLRRWREQCLEWCYDRVEGKRFADQKYLDQWPERFSNVVVCKNKGANLAAFNVDHTALSRQDGKVCADNDSLVFYHYQHLRQLNKYMYEIYEKNKWDISIYRNLILLSLYLQYIDRLRYYEKRYRLSFNSRRQSNNQETFKVAMKKIVNDHPLMYFKLYKGILF